MQLRSSALEWPFVGAPRPKLPLFAAWQSDVVTTCVSLQKKAMTPMSLGLAIGKPRQLRYTQRNSRLSSLNKPGGWRIQECWKPMLSCLHSIGSSGVPKKHRLKVPFLIDAKVVVGAITKGRSSARSLRTCLRSAAAHVMAANLLPRGFLVSQTLQTVLAVEGASDHLRTGQYAAALASRSSECSFGFGPVLCFL